MNTWGNSNELPLNFLVLALRCTNSKNIAYFNTSKEHYSDILEDKNLRCNFINSST